MPVSLRGWVVEKDKKVICVDDVRFFDLESEPKANITYVVKNNHHEIKQRIIYTFQGAEYNEFWENFNSGKYLYEVLSRREGLNFDVDDSIESEFLHKDLPKKLINRKVYRVDFSTAFLLCVLCSFLTALAAHHFWK